MDEICEIIPSQKGNNKINIRGYLMVKDKEQEGKFYWCCEKRKSNSCNGRAVTILLNNSHHLQRFNDHNHTPQASSAEVAKVVAQITHHARERTDHPAQIIQNNIINSSDEIYPYMPSKNALNMKIKRARRADMPPEPQNLNEINIPNSLHYTLNGELFLVKDFEIDSERILLFTTRRNIQHLSRSLFWLMDGTFKTVPTIFVSYTPFMHLLAQMKIQEFFHLYMHY